MPTTQEVYWNDPLAYDQIDTAPEKSICSTLLDAALSEGMTEEELAEIVRSTIPKTAKEMAEQSFIFFIKYYLGDKATNDFAPEHFKIARDLQSGVRRMLKLLPREHAKSTVITFAWTIYCICFLLKRNIVIVSDSKAQAQEFLRNIKTELETNERLIEDFGLLVGTKQNHGKWDEQHVITANQVQIKVLSPNAQVRGLNFNYRYEEWDNNKKRNVVHAQLRRPDLIILDDILNDKFIKNKLVRDKVEDWFFTALTNAMDSDKGTMVVVGTVIHNDDLLSRLWKDTERTQSWNKDRIPACVINEKGEYVNVVWPSRWDADKLKRRCREIGSLAFSKEFLLNPIDDKALYFRKEWYRYYTRWDMPHHMLPDFQKNNYFPLPPDLMLVTAIDPNSKQRDINDYTVVITLGFSPMTRCYYIVDFCRERPSPGGQVREMVRQAKTWGKQYRNDNFGFVHLGFCIETIGYQSTIQYWLRKEEKKQGMHDVERPRHWTREETTVDKVVRCSVLSPMVEQGRLYFPIAFVRDAVTHVPQIIKPMDVMEEEMADFPHGAYDDCVDALQRAYSVLIYEEKRYIDRGLYGPEAVEAFKAFTESSTYGFIKNYLRDVA